MRPPLEDAFGNAPADMPIWARLQLQQRGIRFRRVIRWIGNPDSAGIAVAIADPAFPNRGERVLLYRR